MVHPAISLGDGGDHAPKLPSGAASQGDQRIREVVSDPFLVTEPFLETRCFLAFPMFFGDATGKAKSIKKLTCDHM